MNNKFIKHILKNRGRVGIGAEFSSFLGAEFFRLSGAKFFRFLEAKFFHYKY